MRLEQLIAAVQRSAKAIAAFVAPFVAGVIIARQSGISWQELVTTSATAASTAALTWLIPNRAK